MASLQQLVRVVEDLWMGADSTTASALVFALGFGSPPRVLAVAGSAAGFSLGLVFSALQQRGD
ncbi:MAG: hypothetical protein SWK90_18195 [Chloroflexota bacterium]|nr:hypothetical protein [Chloroflexota bacterium]